MTLQVLISSTTEEVELLTQIQQLVRWSKNLLDAGLSEQYSDPLELTLQDLDRLSDWITGIHSLLTDFKVFGNADEEQVV